MALPEIQTEAVKWQRRLSMLQNAGLPTAPALQLARTDLTRLAQGGSPLAEDEIISMVHSAYTGQVSTPAKPSGTDWNPLHLIGHISQDVQTDVRSFIPGLVHEVENAVNPKEWGALGQDLGKFQFGSISDMAKEVQALPIVGPLVPGMFALSAGTSGITQHPLNFFLDVAAAVSVGSKLATLPLDAAESTTIAALKAGHPIQALAKSTGLEDRLVSSIEKAGGLPPITEMAKQGHYTAATALGLTPLKNSQWAAMPVWRAYGALAQLTSRDLRDKFLNQLDKIIPKNLSHEEKQQIAEDAANFDNRYLYPASEPPIQQIQAAGSDLTNAFSGVHGDVKAYTYVDPEAHLNAKIYWTQAEAEQAAAENIGTVHEIRVDPNDVTLNSKGEYVGRNYLENKFFPADYAKRLMQVHDHLAQFDPRKVQKNPVVSVILPNGMGGTELYAHDALPVRAQQTMHAKQDALDVAKRKQLRVTDALQAYQNKYTQTTIKHKEGSASTAKTNAAARQLGRMRDRVQKAGDVVQQAQAALEEAQKGFVDALQTTPSERWQSMMTGMVRSRAKEAARERVLKAANSRIHVGAVGLSDGLAQARDEYIQIAAKIDNARTPEEMAAAVDPETFNLVMKTSLADWTQLYKAGFDPIFVHQIDKEWYDQKTFPSVHPGAYARNPEDRNIIFDFSPHVLDIHAQMTHQGMEYFKNEGTKQFIDFLAHKSGLVHEVGAITADLEKRFPDPEQWGAVQKHLRTDFVAWDNPHDPQNKYVVPKSVAEGLKTIMEGDKLPFKGVRDPAMRIFRVAVLSGPRHLTHVGLGGLVQVALREPGALFDPTVLAHPLALIKAMRTGEVPAELTRFHEEMTQALATGRLTQGMYEKNIDQLTVYRGSNKMGQGFRESMAGRGLHSAELRLNNLENDLTNWYRAAVYLHEMRKTGGANSEAALALVNKTLIDVNNMTPFERNVIRQVFPFYSFTKHILRYVLTYPADHPLRASILAHLAQSMENDNASGMPGRLSKLFFLGSPDKNGNITSVDFSNLNPFRSMASVFSMQGFLSGLAPELQLGLRMYGINTLTGTPPLHPNLRYDDYTGNQVTTRPPVNPFDWISAFVPQAEILDHFVQFTDTMRYLKTSNPEAYRRSLFQEMNLPFAVAPINIYDVRAKAAAAQYRQASDAVAGAMRTGNTDPLRTFTAVPFEGQLYPGNQVANYLDNFDRIFPGFAPKAVIKKPRRRKTPL